MLHRNAFWSALAGCLALGGTAPLAAEEPAKLPLRKVVLFTSGVGFFQHVGQVSGDARVELRFKIDDVNDLLKSMVVQAESGQVSTINYASKDPVSKQLKSFAVDLTTNPTLADLLQQLRGERVELDAPNKIVGVIVGLEKRKKDLGDQQTIEIDLLTLLSEEGLRSVPLDTVSRLKLTNPQLDAELRKALEVLATAHASDKKAVVLNFLGEGKRKAMVGYVQQTPVWKTSYRLVLDDDKQPLLQGWAIVENTTEDDWSQVDLTLVSGRPISFTMDLYQPLYVPRPEVQLELYSSLRPPVYQQDLVRQEAADLLARAERKVAGRVLFEAAAPAAPAPARAGFGRGLAADAEPAEKQELDLRQGVQAVAQAGDVGQLFQYCIATPVNLPRQQSAMLPILNAEVKGQKYSIYDPAVHAKHPLDGLRLQNTSALHLMQGPITVFDGGTYAGDARIQDLAPNAERLISYALDLTTEVAREGKPLPDALLSVKIIKGTMIATREFRMVQEYTVKTSGQKVKKVLIESPRDPAWELTQPKQPEEKTRDKYRFLVEAKPGVPAKLNVETRRVESQQVALTNIDDSSIRVYLAAPAVSEKVKDALREIAARKTSLEQVARQRKEIDKQIQEIVQEQTRIRQNMERLDRNSELYKRYVLKFSTQEDQIEKLRGESRELTAKEDTLRAALDRYLMELNLQ